MTKTRRPWSSTAFVRHIPSKEQKVIRQTDDNRNTKTEIQGQAKQTSKQRQTEYNRLEFGHIRLLVEGESTSKDTSCLQRKAGVLGSAPRRLFDQTKTQRRRNISREQIAIDTTQVHHLIRQCILFHWERPQWI